MYHKIIVVNVIIISNRKIKSEVKEEYYSTSQSKWVLTSNSLINSNLKGIYYEGTECGVLQNNLDYITSTTYGELGAQNIEKNISKYFRVKSNMIYINVSTSNFSLHNYYLVF